VSLLREGFAGAAARFHLVGLYTLAALLVRFAETLGVEEPAALPLLLFAYVVFQVVICGVFGYLYLDASGRLERPSFGQQAFGLLLPIVWLSLKIGFIVFALAGAATAVVSVIEGGGRAFEEVWKTVSFWGGPAFGLVGQGLTLYSLPLAIGSRFEGKWRTSVRDGCRMFRRHPIESIWIGILLLAMTAVGGTLHYARGPQGLEAEPDVLETLVLLVNSYLSLAAFFAATRVVLGRLRPDAGALPGRDATAPGPPA
jgi:hypothetical protein